MVGLPYFFLKSATEYLLQDIHLIYDLTDSLFFLIFIIFCTLHKQHPQSTTHIFPSLCLRFLNHEHRRLMLCHKTGRGRSMYMFPPSSKVIQNLRTTQDSEVFQIPPVAVTTVVCTSTMTVCGAPSYHNHSVPPGPTVTTGVCLGQQVVPSAHMEALMQHYQAEGFQKRSLDPQQNVQRQVDSLCSLSRRTKN